MSETGPQGSFDAFGNAVNTPTPPPVPAADATPSFVASATPSFIPPAALLPPFGGTTQPAAPWGPPGQSAPQPVMPGPYTFPAAPAYPPPVTAAAPVYGQPAPVYGQMGQGYAGQGYGAYGQGYGGYGMAPQPPKKNTNLMVIIVTGIVVVALIVAGLIWALNRNNTPVVPPTTSSSSQTQPTTGSGGSTYADSVFCIVYLMFTANLNANWEAYQSARDDGDYATADSLVQEFLAEAQQMHQNGPPPELTSALDDMVAYLTKLDAALQNNSMSGITQADVDSYNNAYNIFMPGAQTACFG